MKRSIVLMILFIGCAEPGIEIQSGPELKSVFENKKREEAEARAEKTRRLNSTTVATSKELSMTLGKVSMRDWFYEGQAFEERDAIILTGSAFDDESFLKFLTRSLTAEKNPTPTTEASLSLNVTPGSIPSSTHAKSRAINLQFDLNLLNESTSTRDELRPIFINVERFTLNPDTILRTFGRNLIVIAKNIQLGGEIQTTPASEVDNTGTSAGHLILAGAYVDCGPNALLNTRGGNAGMMTPSQAIPYLTPEQAEEFKKSSLANWFTYYSKSATRLPQIVDRIGAGPRIDPGAPTLQISERDSARLSEAIVASAGQAPKNVQDAIQRLSTNQNPYFQDARRQLEEIHGDLPSDMESLSRSFQLSSAFGIAMHINKREGDLESASLPIYVTANHPQILAHFLEETEYPVELTRTVDQSSIDFASYLRDLTDTIVDIPVTTHEITPLPGGNGGHVIVYRGKNSIGQCISNREGGSSAPKIQNALSVQWPKTIPQKLHVPVKKYTTPVVKILSNGDYYTLPIPSRVQLEEQKVDVPFRLVPGGFDGAKVVHHPKDHLRGNPTAGKAFPEDGFEVSPERLKLFADGIQLRTNKKDTSTEVPLRNFLEANP